MDVVKRNIETLRGSIDIQSSKGKGTAFTIRLPLTLAVINGIIIRAGKEQYIIPTMAVIEPIIPSRGQISSIIGKGKV